MSKQYSDSPTVGTGSGPAHGPVVALDTASAITSVAVWVPADRKDAAEEAFDSLHAPGGRASRSVLSLLDELLSKRGVPAQRIEGVIANRGPGSFTGLRVGLATALGLAESLGARATAVTGLRALAAQAGSAESEDNRRILAVVDALRDEWFAQPFAPSGVALADPEVISGQRLSEWAPCMITGFGLEGLPPEVRDHPEIATVEAGPLAPTLLELARRGGIEWNASLLTQPLYLRAPAAKQAG